MPDGSVWLIKDGKPFGLLKFVYMGIHFWHGMREDQIIEVITTQPGISFYNIKKAFMYKLMIDRKDEFASNDLDYIKECDEVWLEKNI